MKTEHTINGCKIELVLGDITDQQVDAIVNAANKELAGGAGVDGAIHRRGGPSIMAETRKSYPSGCATGSAVITGAGNLPARNVIHTVGPVWFGGDSGEADLLARAHKSSLELAIDNTCETIAFPAISTGVYGYPQDAAAKIALEATANFLLENGSPRLVRFVLFDKRALSSFAAALNDVTAADSAM